jgi:hypothetical protein
MALLLGDGHLRDYHQDTGEIEKRPSTQPVPGWVDLVWS